MLRQIHIFYRGEHIFVHSYALALGDEELKNTTRLIESFIENPMPGKTFHRAIGEKFQIFHRGAGNIYILFITDLIDSISYIDKIIKNVLNKFKELFSNPLDIKQQNSATDEFKTFLKQIHKDLHSKIAIAGPLNSGKTILYNLLRTGQERTLSNFAQISDFVIENLSFDLWHFIVKDNFSLLWNKFIGGADLILLVFDCSNYNIQVFNHFLNFKSKEGRFSKFLIIANKRDLVSDDEIKILKNELNNIDFEEISLNETGSKSKMFHLLREALGLKKTLPDNFEEIITEAETLETGGKLVEAIRKYKDLIFICNEYQDYTHINSFKQKVEELQEKLKKQVESKRKLNRTKRFKVPEKRTFTTQVKVKELPTSKPLPQKTIEKLSTLKITKPKSLPKKKTLKLSPDDFKLDVSAIEQLSKISVPTKKIPTKEKQDIEVMSPEEFKKLTNNVDIAQVLQSMIQKEGSELSLNLCEKFVEEMLSSLTRTLKYDDLSIATECFIKYENQG